MGRLVMWLAVLLLVTPARAEVRFSVGDAYGVPGETATFEVTVGRGGQFIGSASLVLALPAGVTFAVGTDGYPDCAVGDTVTLVQYRFREDGSIRASVLATEEGLNPAGPLHRCRLAIAADAVTGEFPLAIEEATWTDPQGFEFAGITQSGTVHVLADGVATPTQTRTTTTTPTSTLVPSSTTTSTPTPTGTPTPFPVDLPVVVGAVFDPVPPLVADVNADRRVSVADVIAYFRHGGR